MRTIPQIRERLHELAGELGVPELAMLAEETKRRPVVRRARARSARMSDEVAQAIRAYVRARPGVSHMDVAKVFDVNTGRVSEAIRGKRGEGQ